MGRDKALVEVDGVPMATRVAAVLDAAGCHPVVAVGGDAAAHARLGLPAVPDRWPGEGPLGAVVTVLGALHPDVDAVVVAACDLPWLDGLVARFVAAAGSADAVVAHSDRLEPLCAVWARRAHRPLERLVLEGERAVHRALESLRVVTVQVDASAVANVNSPADLPGG
jgi:molybdopterin-guanine dinucleotide biosynthesis protein A